MDFNFYSDPALTTQLKDMSVSVNQNEFAISRVFFGDRRQVGSVCSVVISCAGAEVSLDGIGFGDSLTATVEDGFQHALQVFVKVFGTGGVSTVDLSLIGDYENAG